MNLIINFNICIINYFIIFRNYILNFIFINQIFIFILLIFFYKVLIFWWTAIFLIVNFGKQRGKKYPNIQKAASASNGTDQTTASREKMDDVVLRGIQQV